MRVLALSSPVASHLMPVLPLLWGMRSAGHEVLYLGQPDTVPTASQAGIPAVSVGEYFGVDELFRGLPADRRPIELGIAQESADGYAATGLAWIYHSKYTVGAYLDFARRWRPQLIVADPFEYASLIVGSVLNIPVVHHRWSPEPITSETLQLAKRMLYGRAGRYDLAQVPDPDVLLDPFPAAWALPDVPAGTPIRPVSYNGGGRAPEWIWAPRERRRVAISFGLSTVKQGGLPLMRHLVDAFDGLTDVEAVMTLDAGHQAQLGPVPANVRLVERVPIRELLAGSDLSVHHAGGGSSIAALVTGTPQLLLPQIIDQHIRSRQIVRSGVASQLGEAATQNDPAAIRAAVLRLLDDPGYRRRAIDLRDEAAALPSLADTSARLESLALSR